MLPAGDEPTAALFPDAYASRARNPHVGPLSNQFYGRACQTGGFLPLFPSVMVIPLN
jgi:hypothetical protein